MFTHKAFIKKIFTCLMVLCALQVNAQNIEQTLDAWANKYPVQKLYLHLDRENYFAGQTLWFKSYFTSSMLPSSANSTLFVDLLDNNGAVLETKVLPVFGALSYGQIDLPESLATGSYQLRAYAPLMLNYDKDYIFKTRINIYNREKRRDVSTALLGTVHLRFFPEGGNLVTGLQNNVAFKATDQNGLPVTVKGVIKNSAGATVTNFSTVHDGMGVFSFIPGAGETYYASEGEARFNMPDQTTNGIALQIANTVNGKSFNIKTVPGHPEFLPAFIVGQMQNHVVFRHAITGGKSTVSGMIPTDKLPSGVLQVTFFNSANMPLAERLTFIDNGEYRLPATVAPTHFNNGKRKLNDFSIQLKDVVTGNFSVSVTDADYDDDRPRSSNIISNLLLSSDIPGYVHEPAYYFRESKVNDDIELVMMTNGWRRFNWRDVVANRLPEPQHKDPGYISLSGKVDVRDSKKSFANRDLMVWVADANSGSNMQLVKTDAQGRFKMDSVIFFDKAKVLFSDVMGDKSKFITVDLNSDSLYRKYSLPLLNIPYRPFGTTSSLLANKMETAFTDYTRGKGLMLDNITVHGSRKTRIEQLEGRYMSGLFRGGINSRTFDFTREFIPNLNIFEYLQGRVPGLWIERSSSFFNNYRLYYRQAGNRVPMQLYLDEMPADADMIASLNPNEIAMVKLFPTFVGAPGGGGNGVLAVYTKRGGEVYDEGEGTGDIIDYDGYSIIKEFYRPDYSGSFNNDFDDYRLTLDWQPEIFVSGADQKIPLQFYNNDRTKRFRVVAEGITTDGKLLMVEKIIDGSSQ